MKTMTRIAVGSLIAAGLSFSAQAAEHKLKAALSTGAEVPPVTGAGKGMAELTLNDATKEISWKVTFDGLSGPAIAGHIHGPADATANGGVVASLAASPPGTPLPSPIEGKATLTDAQVADVLAGKTYINLHTMQNKGGEIRGQIGK
jgi:hypothetical protein